MGSHQRVARGARQRGYKGLGHAGTLRGPQAEVRLDRQSPPAFTGGGESGESVRAGFTARTFRTPLWSPLSL